MPHYCDVRPRTPPSHKGCIDGVLSQESDSKTVYGAVKPGGGASPFACKQACWRPDDTLAGRPVNLNTGPVRRFLKSIEPSNEIFKPAVRLGGAGKGFKKPQLLVLVQQQMRILSGF